MSRLRKPLITLGVTVILVGALLQHVGFAVSRQDTNTLQKQMWLFSDGTQLVNELIFTGDGFVNWKRHIICPGGKHAPDWEAGIGYPLAVYREQFEIKGTPVLAAGEILYKAGGEFYLRPTGCK